MKNGQLRLTVGFLVTLTISVRIAADDTPAATEKMERDPVALNIVFGLDPGNGNYDGVVGGAGDTWNLLDVRETSIKSLRCSTGARTPVRLNVSANDGEWGIEGHSGVYHAYIYHNSRDVDLEATIQGLPTGHYKIYVFAHGDAPNQNANIELSVGGKVRGSKATLNDGSWDFRAKKLKEGVQYVSFDFAVGKSEPVKVVSKRDGSSYSMFNAIQIMRLMK